MITYPSRAAFVVVRLGWHWGKMIHGIDISNFSGQCGNPNCICTGMLEEEEMERKLRKGREIRFVEGFTPYAKCDGEGGSVSSWTKITEIALLPSGWVQVEHEDNTTMFYPQHVVKSLKNPVLL